MRLTLTPQEFVNKWRQATLKEHSAAQEHFIDLCRLIGHPTPAEANAKGERFTFEAGASKQRGGQGWADVWKLTSLYNQRPTWLDLAHRKLDEAVLDAYGWPHDLGDEEILERLLVLNLERAGGEGK
jgi:hypothetical protein